MAKGWVCLTMVSEWFSMGRERYPQAGQLLIPADGGSNGYRMRLWALALCRLMQETGLAIEVHHFPSGRAAVLVLHAHRVAPLLDEPCLVNQQHCIRTAQMLYDIVVQIIAHCIGIPYRAAQQVIPPPPGSPGPSPR